MKFHEYLYISQYKRCSYCTNDYFCQIVWLVIIVLGFTTPSAELIFRLLFSTDLCNLLSRFRTFLYAIQKQSFAVIIKARTNHVAIVHRAASAIGI